MCPIFALIVFVDENEEFENVTDSFFDTIVAL
jgi:hypothetical protein